MSARFVTLEPWPCHKCGGTHVFRAQEYGPYVQERDAPCGEHVYIYDDLGLWTVTTHKSSIPNYRSKP